MEIIHEMVLAQRAESGAEEWACPVCPRRLLVRWSPDFIRLILERGDDTAAHVGATGMSFGAAAVAGSGPGEPGFGELDHRWLREHGIDGGPST